MYKQKYLLLLLILLLPVWVIAFSPSFNVKVESSWGNANPEDVQAVIDSASTIIATYTGGRSLDDIIVRNDKKGPISLYERGANGEYVVLLDIKGRYWSQLAYQFSHEACHLLSNYDLAPNNVTRQQWFEESLCEAFSLFVLERMSEQWVEAAPYPNWQSYAPQLQHYVDDMMQQPHRKMIADTATWYRQYQQILEADPYAQNRKFNEKIALHLLALFERNPQRWAAINYLNLGEERGNPSLSQYLEDWYQNTPMMYRDVVAEIQQLFDSETLPVN